VTDDEVYDFHEGTLPLLVSVPHDGRRVPADIEAMLSPDALALPDTDWHVARLYGFCRDLGASLIVARYSRYVVDLNRSPSDDALYPGQLSTGLCPSRTFAGQPIYADGKDVPGEERERRTRQYWRPYHEQLQSCLEELTARHGYALLWDAHSIASRVPRLFEGVLPALNIGTNDGSSCPASIEEAVQSAASGYTSVVNGRFRGGYITRRYGVPDRGWHAIQLELAQRCYMDEDTLIYDATLAAGLAKTLRRMLITFVDSAEESR
jgi:N-formylglutamate amidohydrolase